MAETTQQKRLFLALWPDEVTRHRLALVQKKLAKIPRLMSARPVPADNLHLTTHFLGDVSVEVYAQLRALLDDVRAQPSTLVIDRWGYFPKARVLWLGGDSSAELNDLVAQTLSCVQACVEHYQQKRFIPHITLFRKARHPLEVNGIEPISWRIDRFAVVESVTHPHGAEYTVLDEWKLY